MSNQVSLKLEGIELTFQRTIRVPKDGKFQLPPGLGNFPVRQFVAAKLGSGKTAEEQITGKAEFGGIQIGVHLPKLDLSTIQTPKTYVSGGDLELSASSLSFGGPVRTRGGATRSATPMGLGGGGKITQKIHPDPYVKPDTDGRRVGDIWHNEPRDKAYVYIVHALDWKELTGDEPSKQVMTKEVYDRYGFPWFDVYDDHLGDIAGSSVIDGLKAPTGVETLVKSENDATPNPETKNLW